MQTEEFWYRVYELRKGRSQSWLADELKIPQSTLNSWTNNSKAPPVDTAYEIARILGTTLDYLMFGDDTRLRIEFSPKDRHTLLEYLMKCPDKEFYRVAGGAAVSLTDPWQKEGISFVAEKGNLSK